MPIINLHVAEVTKEQKVQLIQNITKNAAEILEIPESAFHILIQEYDTDNIGIGGKLMSDGRNQTT